MIAYLHAHPVVLSILFVLGMGIVGGIMAALFLPPSSYLDDDDEDGV